MKKKSEDVRKIAKTSAALLLSENTQGKSITAHQRGEDCDPNVKMPTVKTFEVK